MTRRTNSRTVTFTHPFNIDGIHRQNPPGSYLVETDEETIDSLSFVAWRNVGSRIHITRPGVTQVFSIDPVELETILMRDAGMTLQSTPD